MWVAWRGFCLKLAPCMSFLLQSASNYAAILDKISFQGRGWAHACMAAVHPDASWGHGTFIFRSAACQYMPVFFWSPTQYLVYVLGCRAAGSSETIWWATEAAAGWTSGVWQENEWETKKGFLLRVARVHFVMEGYFGRDSCGPFRVFFFDSLSPAFFLLLAAFLALHCFCVISHAFLPFHAFSRAVCIAFPCFSTAFLYFPASCLLVAYSSAFHGLYCRCFVFVASQFVLLFWLPILFLLLREPADRLGWSAV